eukprot:TRINITY_DN2583_c0_g2_i7.p1 TRINITY_DN2583_c0_g2~~TRINITY_DN2583_c0_g2_i7.p1  ORF type:complete len:292 (+),score=-41.10 TRINITY_DN2583_c0_g2_i7:549-1424(+)
MTKQILCYKQHKPILQYILDIILNPNVRSQIPMLMYLPTDNLLLYLKPYFSINISKSKSAKIQISIVLSRRYILHINPPYQQIYIYSAKQLLNFIPTINLRRNYQLQYIQISIILSRQKIRYIHEVNNINPPYQQPQKYIQKLGKIIIKFYLKKLSLLYILYKNLNVNTSKCRYLIETISPTYINPPCQQIQKYIYTLGKKIIQSQQQQIYPYYISQTKILTDNIFTYRQYFTIFFSSFNKPFKIQNHGNQRNSTTLKQLIQKPKSSTQYLILVILNELGNQPIVFIILCS